MSNRKTSICGAEQTTWRRGGTARRNIGQRLVSCSVIFFLFVESANTVVKMAETRWSGPRVAYICTNIHLPSRQGGRCNSVTTRDYLVSTLVASRLGLLDGDIETRRLAD